MGQQAESDASEDVSVEGEVIADLEGEQETGETGEHCHIFIGEEYSKEESDTDVNEHQAEEEEEADDVFHCFTGHTESVFTVTWNPADPLLIASGGQDDVAYLWRTCGPEEVVIEELPCQKLEGHSDSVISVAFNHDGTLLATAGMDGIINIWSTDGSRLQTLEGPSDCINWTCWHPKGNVILAGSNDASIWMWNAQTGACMQVFSGHAGAVTCGRFTEDGKVIMTAGDDVDPSLKFWNPRTGDCTATISGYGYHESGINCIDLKTDGQLILTGSMDCTARLCHVPNAQVTATLSGHEDSVEGARFTETGFPAVITVGLDGKAIIWDGATLNRRQLHQHPEGIACMDIFTDCSLFATGSLDGVLRVWDVRLPASVKESRGGHRAIQCISVVAANHTIITGADDSNVRIHDMRI